MWVNGVEVQPTDSFRATLNNFLATGGDGFTVFREGTQALGACRTSTPWWTPSTRLAARASRRWR
jgi:hypothetical protein